MEEGQTARASRAYEKSSEQRARPSGENRQLGCLELAGLLGTKLSYERDVHAAPEPPPSKPGRLADEVRGLRWGDALSRARARDGAGRLEPQRRPVVADERGQTGHRDL